MESRPSSRDDDALRRLYERARIYALRHAEGPERQAIVSAYIAGALSMREETPLPPRMVLEHVWSDSESTVVRVIHE